jgi:DNA-binding IclR family transcriptional regulator
MELMAVATEEMRNLQNKTNALVLLCAWDVKGVMIVSRSEGNRPQPLQFTIGGSASLASTATGHVFLAFGRSSIGPNAALRRSKISCASPGRVPAG